MLEKRAKGLGAACALGLVAAILAGATRADPQVDPSVRPGDDFYGYANGPWLKATALPAGRSRYDTGAMLLEETARRVQALIEDAAKAPASARARQVGDYYASLMDSAGIEAKGVRPLATDLAAIAAIHDRGSLSAYLGRALRLDDGTNTQTDGLFGVWIHQGFHDPDHYAAHLVQGGLGLADRDDYLASDRATRRETYRNHVATILRLAGFDQPEVRAERVLALEIAIARSHATDADTADVFKTDNPWRPADFAARAPGMDWAAWFKAARLDRQPPVIVWQPSAVVGVAALVGGQPLVAWKDYLAFHLVQHYAAVLPAGFGGPAGADRAPAAVVATNAALGDAVGRLYVARYFPPQAKAAAEAMAQSLVTALRAHVERTNWMSPATRQAALAKLATVKVRVGYPDTWIDYSGLAVVRGDAYGNLRRAEAFAYGRELAKSHRPVDPAEWILVWPQTPGANILFSPNTLLFSASILQPPYFDAGGDAAANYGSAGAGMAHEISHILDELGSIYDDRGRLVRWWTPGDLARYRAATAPLAAQMGGYCPQPGLCVKGDLVLGESSADLVGLEVAHDAYLQSLHGKPDVVKEGLTGEQRFFLAFARRWRRRQSDEALRRQIATDTHAPGEYRADTVRNLDGWARAFDVKPGDRLYLAPEARVRIW